jgi:hypothetical protein
MNHAYIRCVGCSAATLEDMVQLFDYMRIYEKDGQTTRLGEVFVRNMLADRLVGCLSGVDINDVVIMPVCTSERVQRLWCRGFEVDMLLPSHMFRKKNRG